MTQGRNRPRYPGRLVAMLLLPSASPTLAALPGPTQRLGACTAQMASAQELFPRAGGLRIALVRFVGQDETSEKMGADLAYSLSQELPTYIRSSLKGDAHAAGLAEEDLQIAYIPCMLSSHGQAREVGQAWGADLVFWGQASCSRSDPQSCKLAPIVAKVAQVTVKVEGKVEAKRGDVRIGVVDNRKVVMPPATGQFKTSVTLVHWRGLQGRSDQAVRIDPAAVLDLDFPRLASERPLSLFRWAVGVYAFYGQRYALAAARFEEAAAELYSGAEERSHLYRVMGTSYLYAGHPERGVAALEQARDSCESTDARCRAVALNNLGWAKDRLGKKQEALSYYEQALPLQKQVGDRAGEATILNGIGSVYAALGDMPKALSYYEQALPLRKQVGDRAGEASTLNDIGNVYSALGDKPKALSYYEQALPLWKQVGDRAGEASTLNNIGGVYDDLGDKPKALSYYDQALPLWKQVGDRTGEGITLYNLAMVLAKLGRFRPAIQRYREAATRYLARRPPDLDEAVDSLGLAFDVALRSRLWPEAAAVLAEIEGLKPSPVALSRWRARLAGHSAAPDAAARYQELGRLAATLPPQAQASTRMEAQAGELRAQKKPSFVDCPGVVITEVAADSQASRLGLLPGDIVLRYQSQCINEPSKLHDLVQTTQPSAAASLVLVRSDGAQTLSLQGGRVGITASEF